MVLAVLVLHSHFEKAAASRARCVPTAISAQPKKLLREGSIFSPSRDDVEGCDDWKPNSIRGTSRSMVTETGTCRSYRKSPARWLVDAPQIRQKAMATRCRAFLRCHWLRHCRPLRPYHLRRREFPGPHIKTTQAIQLLDWATGTLGSQPRLPGKKGRPGPSQQILTEVPRWEISPSGSSQVGPWLRKLMPMDTVLLISNSVSPPFL
mmetsp:Transcript_36135/g.84561  ORF Transcript_36135/g.84561 Transcript_36135/m.84561 type:complete len:207 (+) Transcript_36135:189-809(+)